MLLFILVIAILQYTVIYCEITSGRIKGEDEPRMVSWKVLQGVTEPFDDSSDMNNQDQENIIPMWKQMKNAADHKAASLAIQQALHEYGQLIRHPYMFGEMPMEERYDVFLSMSKLLKMMGFHQKAELLLYEAMSYTINPHEAHLQLGLLYLDKEDLEKAKLHLKNCLFLKEADILISIYLSIVLLAEGKYHESQYFLSRVLASLEQRVSTLSFMISKKEIEELKTNRVDYRTLSNWIEDLLVKVFYGEFRVTPTTTIDMLKMFSNLYQWLIEGELSGRFLFDLGQSLYEGGRPYIGKIMMSRGFVTSNAELEGVVSTHIVNMRLAFDYPLVPESLLNIVEIYLNITQYLSDSSQSYEVVDFENVVDIYWPLPLLAWSGLPIMAVFRELLWRFEGGPVRTDEFSQHWLLGNHFDAIIKEFHPGYEVYQECCSSSAVLSKQETKQTHTLATGSSSSSSSNKGLYDFDLEDFVVSFDKIQSQHDKVVNGIKTIVIPPGEKLKSKHYPSQEKVLIEVGILGGHMNNHPVGQMIYRRLLALNMINTNKQQQQYQNQTIKWNEYIHITLLALPLIPDRMTNRIASTAHKVVNLPADMSSAWKIIESLHLDVLIFPDWQPFPDVQSTLFQTRRIAPVQICIYVRGSSCISSDTIDYYIMPIELQNTYLKNTIASDINSKVGGTVVFSNLTSENTLKTQPKKTLRPLWKENYAEQIVLLDWPIITTQLIQNIAHSVIRDDTAARHMKDGKHFSTPMTDQQQHHHSSSDGQGFKNDVLFTPLEIEGKIFFEGQPVAVIPFYPMYVHPLMDETLFKIMRAVPSLHVVIALSETLFTGTKEVKHKMSWARKLVRRMWDRGGNLFQRIRLLPSPLNDMRMLQLFRQADMILDSFPMGGSFYYLSLAISVGTPVITMQSGTILETTKEDLKEIRMQLSTSSTQQKIQQKQSHGGDILYRGNPLYHYIQHFDLPWLASNSAIAGFYDHVHLSEYFVANNTANYFTLVCNLALNREFAYSLRVKLLEAVDSYKFVPIADNIIENDRSSSSSSNDASGAAASLTGELKFEDKSHLMTFTETEDEWGDLLKENNPLPSHHTQIQHQQVHPEMQEVDITVAESETTEVGSSNYVKLTEKKKRRSSISNKDNEWEDDCGYCVDDLGRFLLSIGTPFAKARLNLRKKQQEHGTTSRNNKKRKKRHNHSTTTKDRDDDDNNFGGSGAIS